MSSVSPDERFMREALKLAAQSATESGRPFGAVLATELGIVSAGTDRSSVSGDPTDHAETAAIRAAASAVGMAELRHATLYASCEPCVMCAGVIARSGIPRVCFSASRELAERFGFPDVVPAALAREVLASGADVVCLLPEEGERAFEVQRRRSDLG
jgi:guanine deaminase